MGDPTDRSRQMELLWERILDWLEENSPPCFETLRPGAPPDRVAYMEEGFGFRFPPEVREFFLRQQGQSQEAPCGLLDGWLLLSFDEMLAEWTGLGNSLSSGATAEGLQVEGPVQALLATRGWIPFATDFGGSLLCFDLEPARGGRSGQVILVDNQDGARRVLWPGLLELLEDWYGRLSRGEVELEDFQLEPVELLLPGLLRWKWGEPVPSQALRELGLCLRRVDPGPDARGPAEQALAFSLEGLEERQDLDMDRLGGVRWEDLSGRLLSHSVSSLHRTEPGRPLPVPTWVLECSRPPVNEDRLRLTLIRRTRAWTG